ncbi:MAG TPA: glutamate--cysteine ligase [Tepidimicrobium sp.]|nr:glutamate--cysteine ligase [Tepidimicrobium sp.]
MNYNRQIEEISKYFRNSEKGVGDFKIGIEFEHFVIDRDTFKTVSFYGDGGIEETLKELEADGWMGDYEGEYLLGLTSGDKVITLEPGSQLEFSVKPRAYIADIEEEYFRFLKEIVAILERKNQALIAVGYHPKTRIEEIKLLPKKRYDYMFEYFKDKGSHAHNMMKGTASIQIAFDFSSEEDYIKKFQIGNALAPVMYAIFDNAFYFEGGIWEGHNLRSFIWENCDNNRCGIVEGTFDDDFGYGKYAEYILNRPPIFMDDGNRIYFTGERPFREIFDPQNYTMKELEHGLTMFFPDVRTKQYVEIRMMDAVPYPLNFACVALWKGILYDENNLERVYSYIEDIDMKDIDKAKASILKKGLDGKLKGESVFEIANWLVGLAKVGLVQEEADYIQPLEEMLMAKKNPHELVKEKDHLGKKKALEWCILNDLQGVR